MSLSRRGFIASSTSLGVVGLHSAIAAEQNRGWTTAPAAREASKPLSQGQPTFVATWRFGLPACETALQKLESGGDGLTAIETGIRLVEADVSNASVGIGGIPNANGIVELDACIMSGPGHRAGSVAGLANTLHPISVARRVMEKTPHVMLVGEGAREFATAEGFPIDELLTPNQKAHWEKWKRDQVKPPIDENSHDTIAMVGVDAAGDLFGGCSTSGWGFKLPGRVGDSPIIGAGLYVDNEHGAAGATGLGENVMRFCGSFLVVEMMRQGADPTEACRMAIQRIGETSGRRLEEIDINFVAINKAGEFGAAGTSRGFEYSMARPGESRVLPAAAMSSKPIGPEGGNIR